MNGPSPERMLIVCTGLGGKVKRGQIPLTKYLLVVCLLALFLLTTSIQARAEETQPSGFASTAATTEDTNQDVIVKPGLLEAERAALLRKIQEAKGNGIGIQGYMIAFQDLERMVEKGALQESIKARLESIAKALDNQMSSLQPLQTKSSVDKVPSAKKSEKLMTLEQARLYMLSLVNSDRSKHHLAPLAYDHTASIAAQKHTNEMATLVYCRHWDITGKKPDQRYTEAGGTHCVSENVGMRYYVSRKRAIEVSQLSQLGRLSLDMNPHFSVADLKGIESFFMKEEPPNDHHKQQVLDPHHNKLGVGLSYSKHDDGRSCIVIAQEFVDDYGEYSRLPVKILRGKPFEVSGTLASAVGFSSIAVYWEPAPKPISLEEMEHMPLSYSIANDSVASYSVKDSLSPIKVWTNRRGQQSFCAHITPQAAWRDGLYYIVIWASSKDCNLFSVSCRTVLLDP